MSRVDDLPKSVAEGYSATGAAWELGPGRIYNRLAAVLVECSPIPLAGRRVLDLGAGTGAASRAVEAVGGRPVALDAAFGMLAAGRAARPPAVVGDALRLPLRDRSFGAVVAAFSLNHLGDPAAGLREAVRVTEAGGAILAASYADDDGHPVKAAVEDALRQAGWQMPEWYTDMQRNAIPRLATAELAEREAVSAGLGAVSVMAERVRFPDLDARALVEWRLGMASTSWFFTALPPDRQEAVRRDALDRLGRAPALERSVLLLSALAR